MRTITAEICVPGELPEVWRAWNTEEGARTFFALDCKIDLRLGGPYEMYFLPEAQEGMRGGEGCRVLMLLGALNLIIYDRVIWLANGLVTLTSVAL